MAKRRSIIILPVLKRQGKKWFVEYSIREPRTGEMKRKRISDGFDNLKSREVKGYAQKIIDELTKKLKNGWTPWDDGLVIYEDQIEYHNAATVYGRKRKENKTLRSILSDFLLDTKKRVKPKTYESYQSKTRLFALWLDKTGLIENDVCTIDDKVLNAFYDYLITERTISARTLEKYGQNLRSLFRWLIAKKIVKENPVVELPKIPKTVDNAAKPIPIDDLESFKSSIKTRDPQLWLAIQFQFYCFIRPGTELRLMKLSWINFFNGTVTIPQNIAKNGERQTVIIPKQFLEILIKVYNLQNFDKGLYVFGPNGMPGERPMGKNTMRNRFNVHREKLGLSTEYKFYSFKHTGAVMASNAGVPLKDIQMQMRHHSLDVTDKYLRKMKGIDSDALKNRFPGI
jgi:integrase